MRRLAVRVLGPFAVSVDDAPVTAFPYVKVRALLAYLAVESPRPLPRAQLATLLWPDQPERTARGSLNQALTTLRTVLDDKTDAQPLLLADGQSIQLRAVDVDVTQFLALLRASDTHAHYRWHTCAPCAARLRQALDLYRGPFLANVGIPDSDVFEEWASLQREHLLQRGLSTLERLTARAQWCGAYTEALRYARQQVAFEPLIETSQRAVMRLLALNDEPTAALLQYRQLHQLLAHELAAEPEDATTAVFEQIRRGDTAALPSPRPPFRVPAPPTPLVTRSAELQEICERVHDPHVRAVTITGTGGVGKTRLAIEVAHLLRHDFEDGVYWVELAPLADAALVLAAVAQALGVTERPQQQRVHTLCAELRTKHLLLVLDNFEHVVTAAPLVGTLLAGCPALTVLVTSRVPLAIRAEHQISIEPLADADAVALFVQRAQAVGAALDASSSDRGIYSAICRRLDRLPLAIELARRTCAHPRCERAPAPARSAVAGAGAWPSRSACPPPDAACRDSVELRLAGRRGTAGFPGAGGVRWWLHRRGGTGRTRRVAPGAGDIGSAIERAVGLQPQHGNVGLHTQLGRAADDDAVLAVERNRLGAIVAAIEIDHDLAVAIEAAIQHAIAAVARHYEIAATRAEHGACYHDLAVTLHHDAVGHRPLLCVRNLRDDEPARTEAWVERAVGQVASDRKTVALHAHGDDLAVGLEREVVDRQWRVGGASCAEAAKISRQAVVLGGPRWEC